LALQTRTPVIEHQGVEEGGAGPMNPHTAHLSSNTRVSKKVVLALRMSAWSMMGAAEAANAFRYTRATTLSDTFLCTCVGKCQGKTKMSVPDHTIFGHLPLHVSTHTYVCACLYLSNVNTLAVFIVAHNSVFIRTQCLCLSNITHTHTEHTQTHTHMGQVVMPFSSH
jgi:hypothetical protein